MRSSTDALSQHSSYSELSDIDELILAAPVGTQLTRYVDAQANGSRDSILEPPASSSESKSSDGSMSSACGRPILVAGNSSNVIPRTDSNNSTTSSAGNTPGPRKRKFGQISDSPSVAGPSKPIKSAKLGNDDNEPVIISHSSSHHRLFRNLKLPYGVQYEIARLAAADKDGFNKLDEAGLKKLKGLSNAEAVPRIPELFGELSTLAADARLSAKEIEAKAPWFELDLEDKFLNQDPHAGLGFHQESSDWFGGKVHFVGKLITSKDRACPFKVVLKPPELGPSDRFSRRYGSQCFLTISLAKELLKKGAQLVEFFLRPFILGDRVFRAFDAKDGNVFLVCTNEFVERQKIHATRGSETPGATMAKWSSRFALGRSNSAPVLRLNEDAIEFMPDITSQKGSDMTDGAGLINKAGLRLICNRVEMDTWPTAIQCRVGLLVMHPDDTDDVPRIWLRPSQIKVKHTSWKDPETQCRLSAETIINLAENGVPASAFLKMIEMALIELVTPLVTWDGPDAMVKLCRAVDKSGGVMASRMARRNTVMAARQGDQAVSTAWWMDEISGCPSSLEETCLELLTSGFNPATCSVLRSKLEKVVDGGVKRHIESYRIDIPSGMSAMGFLVPDELGVLEEGQIFFKSSRHDLQTRDGLPTDTLLGDVLITRHPCKLPTDVQKWIAVDRPELRHFKDVIVLSVKGDRRAADFLSGGDYDGDKGLLIWQPELVDPFRNAPVSFSEEPVELEDSFSKKNETVKAFLHRTKLETPAEQLREMQKYLLSALQDVAIVGKYSNWHVNATHELGYSHPETIRLAYMFCKTLDGAKTGLTVRQDVFKKDQAKYEKRPPLWKEEAEKKGKKLDDAKWGNSPNLVRDTNKLPPFIMDTIYKHTHKYWGTSWGQELKADIASKFKATPHVVDEDLTAPWLTFVEKETAKREAEDHQRADRLLLATSILNAPGMADSARAVAARVKEEAQVISETDLDKIKNHVKRIFEAHKSKIDKKFTKLPIERRQDILRELSLDFATGPPGLSMGTEEAARIKASYAYWYDSDTRKHWEVKWSRAPWDVAFKELCLIKTRKLGLTPVSSEIYDRMRIRV
ncbi:RNA dependent RNA polymerase-domain-containing protein, partial [Roridomyces roridus]